MIKENIAKVQETMAMHATSVNRKTDDIQLIAVSKKMPLESLQKAYDFGIRDFGENHVKELLQKQVQLPKDIRWHMIGHLQRNKVKQVLPHAYMIHSVDSINLSDVMEHEAVKLDKDILCLLEINVAKEESKHGFLPEDLSQILERFSKYKRLKIMGLMTVAPFVEDANDNREIFRKLKQMSVDIKVKNIDNMNMKFLSMGMSNDYGIAIEEGADMIRVGTSIFGSRYH